MDNRDVADVLGDVARMMELEGEDAFRIRAYRKASESVALLDGDINVYHREGRLREIPGVGKSIGELITELLETGTSPFYESLKKKPPRSCSISLTCPGSAARRRSGCIKLWGSRRWKNSARRQKIIGSGISKASEIGLKRSSWTRSCVSSVQRPRRGYPFLGPWV